MINEMIHSKPTKFVILIILVISILIFRTAVEYESKISSSTHSITIKGKFIPTSAHAKYGSSLSLSEYSAKTEVKKVLISVPMVDTPKIFPKDTSSSRYQAMSYAPLYVNNYVNVSSSVRGNLGESSVVKVDAVNNWLADRWQAAKNMKGS